MTERRIALLSRAGLFLTAIIWGSAFFVVKNSVDAVPPVRLMALRNTFGSLFLFALFFPRIRRMHKEQVLRCLPIGLALFLATNIQTVGITDTTPGKNAFLTAIYCVIVPFLYWIVRRHRPPLRSFVAAFLCLGGIGLVCLSETLSIGFGDAMTLLCGFFFAVHIITVDYFSASVEPVCVAVLQTAFSGVFCWIASLLADGVYVPVSSAVWPGILYLAIASTGIAYCLQVVCQKHTPPAAASLIMSLESVFGVLFSCIFYGEKLTSRLVFGFAVIFMAVLLSEIDPAHLRAGKREGI